MGNLTSKVGHTYTLFLVCDQSSLADVRARLQVSVCCGYDWFVPQWLTSRQTDGRTILNHTFGQTDLVFGVRSRFFSRSVRVSLSVQWLRFVSPWSTSRQTHTDTIFISLLLLLIRYHAEAAVHTINTWIWIAQPAEPKKLFSCRHVIIFLIICRWLIPYKHSTLWGIMYAVHSDRAPVHINELINSSAFICLHHCFPSSIT